MPHITPQQAFSRLQPSDINKDGIVNVTDAMAIVNEINEAKSAAERDTLCPDYYGAKGDGLPLYDWPIRCFNGFVEAEEIGDWLIDGNVFAPSERIKLWFDNLPELITTDNVFFNRLTNHFVLLYEGKYYSAFGKTADARGYGLTPRMDVNGLDESHLWYNASGGYVDYMDGGEPREDVVFSDLTDRRSYVWVDGSLTDIDNLMTDDYTSIMACLVANHGSMRLRPNACYYMKIRKQMGDNSTNPLYGVDGFTIDGNGSTIFARRSDAGNIPDGKGGVKNMDVFRFSNARNGKVQNIHIKALRDRDNGAPSGHKRFSTSDSGLVAFSIISNKDKGRWSCNLTFNDIDCRGMYEDFDIRSGSDFCIKNWRSVDVCQNFAVCKHLIVVLADVTQAPFVGTGMHLNYFGVRNCWTFNSTFRQGGPFTSVMLTHHASTQADGIHYIGCTFEANRIAQGTNLQHQTYDNCIFRQVWLGIMTDEKFGKSSALIVGTKTNLIFDSCLFEVDGERLISTAAEDLLLSFKNCAIIGKNVENITMITGFTGKLTAESNYGEWAGGKGVELW